MNRERKAEAARKTGETEIELQLNLDGKGEAALEAGLPFWQHMLEQWCRHGSFEFRVKARGDTEVDHHHLVEDLGLALGSALQEALGEKKGINRYGCAVVPMDDALVLAAVDLSGRPYLKFEVPVPGEQVGNTDTELAEEFWRGFVNEGRFNLHFKLIHGHNTHHILEALFKAAGKAMGEAVSLRDDNGDVPSTKGTL